MKRYTANKNKSELDLKLRLALVRTTIRELTPGQLVEVQGATAKGTVEAGPFCPPLYTDGI